MTGTDERTQVDYSLAAIEGALKAWPQLLDGVTIPVIHVRADMHNAMKKLTDRERETIAPILQYGGAAFEIMGDDGRKLMSYRRWGHVIRRLFQILNVEGTA
jgi:hypothetical protein